MQVRTLDLKVNSFEIFRAFSQRPNVFFLDSSLQGASRGRYSIIGFEPFKIFSTKGKNSLSLLRQRFNKEFGNLKIPKPFVHLPFIAGIAGIFSYDYGFQFEEIIKRSKDDLKLPDCYFGFYDKAIVIDHKTKKVFLTATGLPLQDPLAREKKATADLLRMEREVKEIKPTIIAPKERKPAPKHGGIEPVSNFTKNEYLKAILKALKYIKEGDIYQVNLAQRFTWDCGRRNLDSVALYSELRALTPTYFSGYFNAGDFEILSSSPEQFMELKDGWLRTTPMKGTRRRGKDALEDGQLSRELLKSPKEKAELLMVTDLERNDLGRVCRFGTVKVQKMRTLETYQNVFQTTSTVTGQVDRGRDAFDVIEACFPSGSVTGCPKIRAMEIIEELEPHRRGFYTGSLGFINADGSMGFNILIRSLLVKGTKVYYYAGGGIVADSHALDEYKETLVKSNSLKEALTDHDKN